MCVIWTRTLAQLGKYRFRANRQRCILNNLHFWHYKKYIGLPTERDTGQKWYTRHVISRSTKISPIEVQYTINYGTIAGWRHIWKKLITEILFVGNLQKRRINSGTITPNLTKICLEHSRLMVEESPIVVQGYSNHDKSKKSRTIGVQLWYRARKESTGHMFCVFIFVSQDWSFGSP